MRTSKRAMIAGGLSLGLITLYARWPAMADDDDRADDRRRMIAEIRENAEAVGRVGGHDGIGERVLAVMGEIPRHRFVPERLRHVAYSDRPLPIGYNQTISQPYIVALMTELLDVEADDTVLEIGTGSGYQATVLARLAGRVHTIEIVPQLAAGAQDRLAALGFDNVDVRQGDGYFGWQEAAPFDAIVVTAAAGHVPPPLVKQLRPGGTMVVPVGPPFFVQHLILVRKQADGSLIAQQLLPVRFVPLTGEH